MSRNARAPRLVLLLLMSLASLALFSMLLAAIARAATGPDPESSSSMAQTLFDGVVHGQWWLVAGAALSLVTLGLRSWHPSWLGGDRGGVILVSILAITGGLGSALVATGDASAINLTLLAAIAKVLFTAISAYVMPKKLLFPAPPDELADGDEKP